MSTLDIPEEANATTANDIGHNQITDELHPLATELSQLLTLLLASRARPTQQGTVYAEAIYPAKEMKSRLRRIQERTDQVRAFVANDEAQLHQLISTRIATWPKQALKLDASAHPELLCARVSRTLAGLTVSLDKLLLQANPTAERAVVLLDWNEELEDQFDAKLHFVESKQAAWSSFRRIVTHCAVRFGEFEPQASVPVTTQLLREIADAKIHPLGYETQVFARSKENAFRRTALRRMPRVLPADLPTIPLAAPIPLMSYQSVGESALLDQGELLVSILGIFLQNELDHAERTGLDFVLTVRQIADRFQVELQAVLLAFLELGRRNICKLDTDGRAKEALALSRVLDRLTSELTAQNLLPA